MNDCAYQNEWFFDERKSESVIKKGEDSLPYKGGSHNKKIQKIYRGFPTIKATWIDSTTSKKKLKHGVSIGVLVQQIPGYLMMRNDETHIILLVPIFEVHIPTLPPLRSYFKWQISHKKIYRTVQIQILIKAENWPRFGAESYKASNNNCWITRTRPSFRRHQTMSPFTRWTMLNRLRKMKYLWRSVVLWHIDSIRKMLKLVAWYLFLTMSKQLFQIVWFYHIVSSTPY